MKYANMLYPLCVVGFLVLPLLNKFPMFLFPEEAIFYM